VLEDNGVALRCPASRFEGRWVDGVAAMLPLGHTSFFDDKFEVMQRGHEQEGEHRFCYRQQMELLEKSLAPGDVLLDIGCGPKLPYRKPSGVRVIGLDPSLASMRANRECDLRIFGSAYEIPLASAAVDAIVCIYSVHHMVGPTLAATETNVRRAFREFGRVLKPGGSLLVFEMTPIGPFAWVQRAYWNPLRARAPHALDMRFFTAAEMARFGREELPPGSALRDRSFAASPFTTFPPAFSLPWLRVPRFLYPLQPRLYRWDRATG
jgi:SAM-dependent methyltransferase